MIPVDRPIPDLWLEQYALGELSNARRGELEQRLAGDREEQARLAALRDDTSAVLERLPPPMVVAEVCRRADELRRGRRRFWVGLASAVAAVMLVALLLPRFLQSPLPAGAGLRAKGAGPRLVVFRWGRPVHRLTSGTLVGAGDRIQLGYYANGARHGVILSLDGAGEVTRHFPVRAGGSTVLSAASPAMLPFSYQLDAAPDFERFYFVTSADPIDLVSVKRRLRAHGAKGAGDPEFQRGLKTAVFLLRKRRGQ